MLFPGRRRRREQPRDPDPELMSGSGDDRSADVDVTAIGDDVGGEDPNADRDLGDVDIDLTVDRSGASEDSGNVGVVEPGSGLTSLESLLADPTPDPRSPTSGSAVSDQRTYVLQSVGVGELPDSNPSETKSGDQGSTTNQRPVSFTGSSGGLLLQIPVNSIQPNEFQPRRRFEEDALASLTESVRELGVLQPILVRRLTTPVSAPDSTIEFELVAGERRWRAARRAGLTKVPAIVRDVSDLRSLEEAIVENLHRSDLNPLEEAAAYQQLIDEFGLSQAQVAQRVGKSRSAVANTLRLIQLPVSVQRLVVAGDLSAGHARAVLVVPAFDQPDFAARIVEGQLSVRQAEEMAQSWSGVRSGRRHGSDSSSTRSRESASPNGGERRSSGALEVEKQLADRLDTRIRVEESAKGGRIVIDFAGSEDLQRIFGLLLGDASD